MLVKKSILKKKWYEEVAEYLEIDPFVVKNLNIDSEARKKWEAKYPPFNDSVNSSTSLVDKKHWIDRWRKNYSIIVAGERIAFKKSGLLKYKLLVKWLRPRLGKKPVIIDYGCNCSMFCRMFSEYLPDAEYILVDVDSPALKYAYQRCRLFAKNVKTIAITEEELTPVLPESDLIFCRSVMEHLWYPDVALENFHNSLIDKGLLITNFAGRTGDKALKSDTQRAYDLRDRNIVFTYNHFSLVYGKNYRFVKGSFKEDGQLKVWRKKQEANSYSVKC